MMNNVVMQYFQRVAGISLLLLMCTSTLADRSETSTHAADSFELNFGLSGSWANPESPGQGFFFDVNPELKLFWMSWFTFGEAAGDSQAIIGYPDNRWFVALGSYTTDSAEVSLKLLETEGGVFDDPMAVSESDAGTIVLNFESCSKATLTFSIFGSGLSAEIPIERLTSTAACEATLPAP